MHEIDLIPGDYRRWLAQRRSLVRAGAGAAVLVAVIVGVGLHLDGRADRVAERVAALEARNAKTAQQRAELEALQAQKAEYERQWSLLRGLRAGADAEDIFVIVDRALNGRDVWFDSWRFRRAGVVVDAGQGTVETGYFIIVQPADDGRTDGGWQVETHMAIQGHARDHQALSTFVRALFEQPEIVDVGVQRTSLADYGGGRAVLFDMTVVLNSAMKES